MTNPKDKLDPKKAKEGKLNLASKALHPMFEELLAIVAEASLEKGYEPLNWLNPKNEVTILKLISASKRHINKFIKGTNINEEEKTLLGEPCKNKTNHLVYAAYSLLMAAVITEENIEELDDRSKTLNKFYRQEILSDLAEESQKLGFYDDKPKQNSYCMQPQLELKVTNKNNPQYEKKTTPFDENNICIDINDHLESMRIKKSQYFYGKTDNNESENNK